MKRLLKKILSAFHITWETENYCAHTFYTWQVRKDGEFIGKITVCTKCHIDKHEHDMQMVQEYAKVAAPSDFGTAEDAKDAEEAEG